MGLFPDQEIWPFLVSVAVGALAASMAFHLANRKPKRRRQARKTKEGEKFQLYHEHTFRSARCTWMIDELGIQDDFEIIPFNPYTVSKEEKEQYKDTIHPHGQVPGLVLPDGRAMIESGAICMYLAELYGDLLPDPEERTTYYSWIFYGVSTVDPIQKALFVQYYRIKEDQQDAQLIKLMTEKHAEFTRALERHLEDRSFICGDELTTADIIIGYNVFWASVIKGGQLLSDYPQIQAYLARLKSRDIFIKNMGTARECITGDWILLDSPHQTMGWQA